jgi:hypothetical protein
MLWQDEPLHRVGDPSSSLDVVTRRAARWTPGLASTMACWAISGAWIFDVEGDGLGADRAEGCRFGGGSSVQGPAGEYPRPVAGHGGQVVAAGDGAGRWSGQGDTQRVRGRGQPAQVYQEAQVIVLVLLCASRRARRPRSGPPACRSRNSLAALPADPPLRSGDRRRASLVHEHGQGAHAASVPEAWRAQTRRGRGACPRLRPALVLTPIPLTATTGGATHDRRCGDAGT